VISTAFKTSYRILRREKLYAFINIFGLSLAMACALILGLYLLGELTYDRHFEGYEDVYRIETEMNVEGSATSWALSAPTLGLLLMPSTIRNCLESAGLKLLG
jgi:putative ABC transport system permease protein